MKHTYLPALAISLTVLVALSSNVVAQDAEKNPAEIAVKATVETNEIFIGRQFTVRFDFTYPEGTRIYFPEKPETKPFVLVASKAENKAVLGAGTSEHHELSLLSVRSGDLILMPFEVPVVLPDGQASSVPTPQISIKVASSLGNEETPKLASPGETVPVPVRNDLLIWGLAAILVAGFAALIAIFAYRRYRAWVEAHRPPPPPIPAHELAYRRLREIELMGLIDKRQFKELALMISDVVREFLGGKLDFPGSDSTTWETIVYVKERKPDQSIGRLDVNELDDFLNLCDLIKFAKFEPSPADAVSLLRRGRDVVDRVMAIHTDTEQGAIRTDAMEGTDEI
jgi:hypothetical protein